MSKLIEYKFESVYEIADLVDSAVNNKIELWNHDKDYFERATTSFNKETVLHQYIVCVALNYHYEFFCDNDDILDDEILIKWYGLFETYSIEIKKYDFEKNEVDKENDAEKESLETWFEENVESFVKLFDKMAYEVFYILFGNRRFLLRFNNLITETVKEFKYDSVNLNEKGRIIRKNIPLWVKRAVFMRDKGRCVFCNTDLTGLPNTYVTANYDHMIPIDKFGINDPCNIQLSCEKCNKSKNNKDGTTTDLYYSLW